MSNYKARRVKLEDVTLPGEIWKDVPNKDGNYKVSNLGRIYSHVSCHVLKTTPHKTYGYVSVPMGRKEGRNGVRVHRLVAQAFLPNPENKAEVNHINKDKADNRVENLEWVTGWENTQHKYGRSIWHGDQGRIAPSNHSVVRRKLQGFSKVIIPMIHELISIKKVA